MDGLVLRNGELFSDLRPLAPHGVNDMISHPQGWSWVGQFGFDRHAGESIRPSTLIRVDPGGPDRRTLFLLSAATFGDAASSLASMTAQVERVQVDVAGAGWP
jgi:hypothetical protein